jgi:4,5-DOPA dioxygenase extradiol
VTRAPVLFVSHGAPTAALDRGPWAQALAAFGAAARPRALVVVSAHWTSRGALGVTSSERPGTIHDFVGFPRALYQLTWPAPGAPDLAAALVDRLSSAGFPSRMDPQRGLDHGAWVPLRLAFPAADVPTVQLALPEASPPRLLALGQALSPLRDEGVLLVLSGGAVHNLGELNLGEPDAPAATWAREFGEWLEACVTALDGVALAAWRERAPHASRAHPTAEHLAPLLVAVGAARPGDQVEPLHRGVAYGALDLLTFLLRPAAASP